MTGLKPVLVCGAIARSKMPSKFCCQIMTFPTIRSEASIGLQSDFESPSSAIASFNVRDLNSVNIQKTLIDAEHGLSIGASLLHVFKTLYNQSHIKHVNLSSNEALYHILQHYLAYRQQRLGGKSFCGQISA